MKLKQHGTITIRIGLFLRAISKLLMAFGNQESLLVRRIMLLFQIIFAIAAFFIFRIIMKIFREDFPIWTISLWGLGWILFSILGSRRMRKLTKRNNHGKGE